MGSLFSRYLNLPRRLKTRPGRFMPKVGAQAPGNMGDPKNKQAGGLRRFERWYDRPLRAWKLYWRRERARQRSARQG